jgi:hypothetical protein
MNGTDFLNPSQSNSTCFTEKISSHA